MSKLNDLKKKLLTLREAYHEDIGMSYREATQTQMEVEMLEKKISQLETLEESSIPDKKYILKGKDTLTITLTSGEIDTKNLTISFNSPLGKNLQKSKIGDMIRMGKKEYKVERIN